MAIINTAGATAPTGGLPPVTTRISPTGMYMPQLTSALTNLMGMPAPTAPSVAGQYNPLVSAAQANLANYSPAAMSAFAQKSALAQINPQIAAQQAAYGNQAALLNNLYNRQTGFSLALASLADPNAKAAEQSYLDAANTMGALGQGITGAVGQDWQNAAGQAAATAKGMTNQGSVQGLYDPSGLQSSGYTTGFALPGQSLAQQAIVAASNARNQQIASANQLGVEAANTQAQQSLASGENVRALAAIRAQAPAIYNNVLQSQVAQRQSALENLTNVVGARAGAAQSAAQFAANMREQHASNVISGVTAITNAAVAGKYLGIQDAFLGGKVTAQTLANIGQEVNMTGRMPDGSLAAGWVMFKGQPVNFGAYVNLQLAQARKLGYLWRGQAANTAANAKMVTSIQQAVALAAQPGGPAKYQIVPTYKIENGKSVRGPDRQRIVPGTGTYDQNTNPHGATAIPYGQAVASIATMMGGGPQALQRAAAYLQANPAYSTPGQNGVPFTAAQAPLAARNFVRESIGLGKNPAEVRAQNAATGTMIPPAILNKAIQQAYGGLTAAAARVGSLGSSVFGNIGR